ncbi:MAG: DNA-3-methyladenine glycosylase family protein [Candidatus Loosdrechtia sp.]|uniref:DNA-3-methyladenine glycosylase family protein n=1 Tax=Candidatus Loosdrechtia sp. TaxID=3101272 RepID=UPI003A71706E|nr:MAG: DNA glycosylase [Candidatus Jettenia sp. AMX2]
MPKIKVKDFNLEYTLFCGQVFRVSQAEDWYYIITRDRIFKIRQFSDYLEFHGIDKEFLVHYLALDEPYSDILGEINKDPCIDAAIRRYHGLRIIRQDPWECFISFLCSSAANIPKIQLNLELLSKIFGKRICLNEYEGYAFPNPGGLNNYENILMAKTGFRAKFILSANRLVSEEFLLSLRKLPYSEAKKALKNVPGIGDKIADCILLFSLGFTGAFPVDTWMKKILQKLYFGNRVVSNRLLSDFGIGYFGKYAGYAQQFLYLFARESGLDKVSFPIER